MVEHNQSGQGLALIGIVLAVVSAVALVGIWLWRRMAVYLFGALAVVGIGINVWAGVPSWALLVRLVILGALVWCIKEKWAAFR
jgi:hypothetical protein